jgi:UDPglucose 6-dehydrogenase
VITANERRKNVISTKIIRSLGGDLHGKKVAVLGLAFKANTDDMRDSPALAVIPTLVEAGAKVQTYDPEATKNAQTMLKSSEISWEESIEACLKGVDAAVILTEWAEFADIDWRAQKSNMGNPCVIDYRNLFSPEEMEAAGIEYISVGRVSKKDSPKKPAAQAVS